MINKWAVTGIIFLISVILFAAFIVVTLRKEGGDKEASRIFDKYFGKRINKHRLNLFFQVSYVKFTKLPIIGRYVYRIRKRLESLHSYDEYTIRRETMRITFITLSIITFTVLFLIIVSRDVMTTFWVLLGAVVLNGIMLDTFVNKVEDRLLKKSITLMEDNRDFYQQTNNVEEALYQANEVAPGEAAVHGKRIYEVLTAENQTTRLESYYNVAPNRFFKLFAAITFLVFEFGDRTVEKRSMFLHAITQLVKVIREEILRRDRLNYLFKGLTTISIVPILFTSPLEIWARKYFPIMSDFYDGKLGLISKISFFAVVLICYLLLKKMLENDEMRYVSKSRRINWEKKAYELAPIRWIVDRMTPKKHKRAHPRLIQLLKDANSPLTIEWLYIHRIMASFLCFVVTLGLFFYMHTSSVNDVLQNPLRGMGMYGKLDVQEVASAQQKTDFDRDVIKSLQNMKDVTPGTVVKQVSEATNTDGNDPAVIKTAQRIFQKYNFVKSEYMKWWELIIGVLISVIAFNAPIWLLYFQKRMRQMDMQAEVDQYHTIISILMEYERIDVETVLEWMERFAIIFKDPIKNCLNDFSSGQFAALEKLKQDASFPTFVRIVQKLQRATEKISIKEAFDDLESQREHHAEERKDYFQRMINTKSTWGVIIAFIPMGYLMFVMLVLPMLYLSIVQTGNSLGHFIHTR